MIASGAHLVWFVPSSVVTKDCIMLFYVCFLFILCHNKLTVFCLHVCLCSCVSLLTCCALNTAEMLEDFTPNFYNRRSSSLPRRNHGLLPEEVIQPLKTSLRTLLCLLSKIIFVCALFYFIIFVKLQQSNRSVFKNLQAQTHNSLLT